MKLVAAFVRGFGWGMFLLNAGAAAGSAVTGDVLWTVIHAVLAGVMFYQLRTYAWLRGG